jgi:hypothetical protein
MSTLDLFKGNPLVNSDLFKSLMDTTRRMAGGMGGGPRISIRGSKWRLMEGGNQVSVSKSDTMNMVVLDAAPVSRTYYEGAYDPDNPSAPTCWSSDTNVPSSDVPEEKRQAARCSDCPMNVKGSGQNNTRACRFSQRLAVALEGELEKVYQLQLPAASLFGEPNGKLMGLQAYMKFLAAHNTPAIAVLTEAKFDEDATAPKLYFRPVRALDEEELPVALASRDSEETKQAITLSVYQTDATPAADSEAAAAPKAKAKARVEDDEEEAPPPARKPRTTKPKARVEDDEEEEAPPPKAKAKAKAADEDEDDDVGDVKVETARKKAPEPTSNKLADLLSQWDDE